MTVDIEARARALAWWREAHTHDLLTLAEELALGTAVQAGGPDAAAARDALILRNVRLAIHEAGKHRYQHRGMPLDDLIQHALLGLMTAVDKYDPARGLRFSTMATNWIRQSIERALDNNTGVIRLPVHLVDRMVRVERAERAHLQLHGEAPDDDALAAAAGCSAEQVRRAREAAPTLHPLSLEWRRRPTLSDEGDDELADVLADPQADPERDAERAVVAELLSEALAHLAPRKRAILTLRYGLGGEGALTLQAVGDRLGLTRERVRQLEREALDQLRQRHELHGLLGAA